VKPTVDILDSLLREADPLAAHEGVTRATLIERGLHCAVADSKSAAPFKLRRASVEGKGLQPELRNASWDQLLDLIYEGRG